MGQMTTPQPMQRGQESPENAVLGLLAKHPKITAILAAALLGGNVGQAFLPEPIRNIIGGEPPRQELSQCCDTIPILITSSVQACQAQIASKEAECSMRLRHCGE